MRMIDEDEVGLKEKPEYKIHQTEYRNKTRSTGSVGKGLGSQLCHDWELHTRKQAGLFLPRTPDWFEDH